MANWRVRTNHEWDAMKNVVVLVPIYKEQLDAVEVWALDASLQCLQAREVRFIGPEALVLDFYAQRYPAIPLDRFAAPGFASIEEYNRLLLSPGFYQRYAGFAFMLILQTDAIVFRDALDFWCARPFDYVGAPWPKPFELNVQTGRFEGGVGKYVRVLVGNGGLSLRRIEKCLQLLQEFPVELQVFTQSGSSEDLFFSVMGSLSGDFVMPNEVTASRFAMEGLPSHYFKINGGHLPMGAHAWHKNEPAFWRQALPELAELLDQGIAI